MFVHGGTPEKSLRHAADQSEVSFPIREKGKKGEGRAAIVANGITPSPTSPRGHSSEGKGECVGLRPLISLTD